VENGKFGKKQDKEREMYHYLLSSGLTRTLLLKGKWNQCSKLLNKKKREEEEKEHATVKERKKPKKKKQQRNGEREKQGRTIVGCEDVPSSHT
jgi:hypothetical protein